MISVPTISIHNVSWISEGAHVLFTWKIYITDPFLLLLYSMKCKCVVTTMNAHPLASDLQICRVLIFVSVLNKYYKFCSIFIDLYTEYFLQQLDESYDLFQNIFCF